MELKLSTGGDVIITNCTFQNNSAYYGGVVQLDLSKGGA